MSKVATVACAIYTRKSSEEGLDQEFNSLDAQREACEAYIISQKHQGWVALPDLYDDGGLSGGTLQRPALKRLLQDIEAGKIHTVIVYKVDRLTRSLVDFVKIVENFDAKGVSFVSVTQQFNTTSSMGRLTLNMLLSFAQFEREVTGERIRDKIAASKRKGMWMGGLHPLGYDTEDRKLVVNMLEAETVRHIFQRYLQLGSVRALKEDLDRNGVVSKQRVNRHGRTTGSKPIARGALYTMLSNPIYIGKIAHKGTLHPGLHEPIVEEELWNDVQSKLASNRTRHRSGARFREPSLLAGLVYDSNGEPMTPSHASKKGKRYRYYISKSPVIDSHKNASKCMRIPAGDLEYTVADRFAALLRSEAELDAVLNLADTDLLARPELLGRASDLAAKWDSTATSEQRRIFSQVVSRVNVSRELVEINIRSGMLANILTGDGSQQKPKHDNNAPSDLYQISIPVQLKRTGMEMKLIVEGADTARSRSDPHLLQLLARAEVYKTMFLRGTSSISEMAQQQGVCRSYFTRVLRIGFLSPTITKAILAGRQPSELTARKLAADTRFPVCWQQQYRQLAMTSPSPSFDI